MIIVSKSRLLKFKFLKFKCAIGKGGIGNKKREGDMITPKGTYKLIKIYYRQDRIKKIKSKLKLIRINKRMGWCNDPVSKNYNKLINLPSDYSHEKLYRNDHLYDIIIVINFNMSPIIKNKGSAIFIHITKKNYLPTEGCLGLKKNDLIKLVEQIKKNEIIKII